MISYEFLHTFLFKRPLRVAAIILSLVGTKEGKAYSQECFYILQKYYNSFKIIFQLLFVPSIFVQWQVYLVIRTVHDVDTITIAHNIVNIVRIQLLWWMMLLKQKKKN